MVQFDVTDYINKDGGNHILLKHWLYEHAGKLDASWYYSHSSTAHPFEARGYAWHLYWVRSVKPSTRATPLRLIDWILEIQDDLVAVHFRLYLPDVKVVK